jgi:AcrR family transcriptional regulator
MGRRLTREQSAERTRSKLLQAAEAVFLESGFHSATLENVAERAGFTTGAVYSRFGGKADLFLALLEDRNPRTVRAFADVVAEVEDGRELVGSFTRWWSERLREGPAWSLVLVEFWTSAGRDPVMRERFAASHERLMSSIGAIVDEAAARLGVQLHVPSIELARVTTALARGLALERLVNQDAVDEGLAAWAFDALGGAQPELLSSLSISAEGG